MEENNTTKVEENEPEKHKEEIDEYIQLVEKELAMYEAELKKAEYEYKNLNTNGFPPLKLSEKQQKFLDERPNYAEYLSTVKKFHDLVYIKQSKEYQDMKANMLHGDELVKNSLKVIFNL